MFSYVKRLLARTAFLVTFIYTAYKTARSEGQGYFSATRRAASEGYFVGGIVGILIAILVAVALLPSIATGINSLTSGASAPVTGTAATLLGNIVLFIALALFLVVVAFALAYLRGRGKMGRAYDMVKDAEGTWRVADARTTSIVPK